MCLDWTRTCNRGTNTSSHTANNIKVPGKQQNLSIVNEPSDGGLSRQVVLIQRCVSITEVAHGTAYSGLSRQVVLIQRCVSITEVAHGAAYSGHYRQVVFLYKWS